MSALTMQIAFTVPLGLLVALAASGYQEDWFFPACMVIVGAHYLPFTFLYGMRLFAVLAGCLVSGGVVLGSLASGAVKRRGWVGGALLLVFAFLVRSSGDESRTSAANVPGTMPVS